MSCIEQSTISLQHDIDEQYQYQPGEIVRGQVRLVISKAMALKTITVKVNGEGNVSWQVDGDGEIVQAQEIYVDSVKSIVETAGQDPIRLEKGSHEFAFDYALPENIPSSYIGKFGNVTYTIRAMVIGSNSTNTSICSEPFLVLRRHQLSPGFEEPIAMSCEKRLWASCTFGKLHMRVSLDRRGGVPGEDVFLQAEIKNSSRRTATAMQGSIIMRSMFHAQNHYNEFRQVISKKRDEFDVTHNEGRRWNFVRLTLPPYIPESSLELCDIIELDYIFQFRVELTGGAEVKLESPFTVGAMPKGLELPADQRKGVSINRHWTVRAKGMMGVDEPEVDYDDEPEGHEWNIETVPELRAESSVISNPLFRNSSFLQNGVKVLPDDADLGENTRL